MLLTALHLTYGASALNNQFYVKDAFKGMNVQVRLSQQSFELAVLQFQLAQAFGLAGVHAAVLGAPLVEAGITEAVLAPDFLDRHVGFGLPQKSNDLLFAVFAWFACPSFSIVTDFLEI